MNALGFKIIAIFEIMLASLAGAGLPFLYISMRNEHSTGTDKRKTALDKEPLFFKLKAVSIGVVVGVALLHLFPDADEILGERYGGYPYASLAVAVGVVLCLSLEEFALWVVRTDSNHHSDEYPTKSDLTNRLIEGGEDNEGMDGRRSHSMQYERHRSRLDSTHELGLVVSLLASNDTKTLLKAYVLEGAIAVHSIIMGTSLGAMSGDELNSIKILMLAFGIHQFLEGVSLGCAISATELSKGRVAGLVVFFSLTLPVGIIIGDLLIQGTSDGTGEVIEGCANGLAAGILIYVSMVEMLAEEFTHELVEHNFALKFQMIIGLVFGLTTMAVLAIWA